MRSSDSGKKQNFFWRHFNGIAMAAIVLILGGTVFAVYKANVKPPVKQPEPVEAEPLPEEEQAHRDRAMHSTKITAITLFIFFNLHSKAASIVSGHLFL